MVRLNVYLVLGLLDGYYTSIIVTKPVNGRVLDLMIVTVLVNVVTGFLSSYIINASYLRDIERRLLVKKGYLTGSLLYRSLIVRSIIDTVYWALASAVGSLTTVLINSTNAIIGDGVITLAVLYLIPPVIIVYTLSKLTDVNYLTLVSVTIVLTLMVYGVSRIMP